MSGYQGLPNQQPAPLYYDGLEVDVRSHSASPGLETVSQQPDYAAPEVVYSDVAKQQPDHAGPQAIAHSSDQKHLATQHGAYLHVNPVLESAPPSHAGPGEYSKLGQNSPEQAAAAAPRKRKNRLLWLMVGVLVALLAVGAVVGGVVGSRAAKKSATATATATVSLNNIMSNSNMAATGWREGSTFHIRLYYQGPDQMLRYSNFTSTAPEWSSPVLLDSLQTPPRANTSIAAAVDIGNTSNPGLKLYYLDDEAMIRNQVWDYLSPGAQGSNGTDGASDPGPVAPTSRLSSYWPYLLAQDSGGKLRWWHFLGEWEDQNVTIRAPAQSPFVAIPALASFLDAGAFLYRRSGGDLYNYFADQSGNNDGTSWANGNLARFSIPANSAIGAFVTARTETKGDDNINTYIVYQDDAGALQMVWQNSASDWQGPKTFDAFKDADKGTGIACVTAAAWNASGVDITSATDLSRCYFQVKGQVREVHWTGTDWDDLGFLPIT